MIQQQIDNTQMGEVGDKDVTIICNECGEKSQTKFHIIAHKCQKCNSFNTALSK
jgi:RING finger/CHY zinc finger protein 1